MLNDYVPFFSRPKKGTKEKTPKGCGPWVSKTGQDEGNGDDIITRPSGVLLLRPPLAEAKPRHYIE